MTDHRINLSLSGIDSIMEGDYEIGTGLEYMISQLEREARLRKLQALLEMAEAEEAEANGSVSESSKGKGKKK